MRLFPVILLTCFSLGLRAQLHDFGFRPAVAMEYAFTGKWSAQFEEQLTFRENATELRSLQHDFGVTHKLPVNGLRLGLNYMHTSRRDREGFFSGRNRWYMDLSYRRKFNSLNTIYRIRYQQQNAGRRDEETGPSSVYLRNRITVKYTPRRANPYVYTELFTDLQSGYNDRIRFCLGLDVKLSELHTLDFYYLHQREFNVREPERHYFAGITYSLDLNTLFSNFKSGSADDVREEGK